MARLETERLILRNLEERDLPELHRLLSDRDNMYYLDDIATETLEESRENLVHAMANADGRYFCLESRESGRYIGQVGYTITDETPVGKVVHMGYFLLAEFHGRGFATEAVRRILEFAFREDGCVRVTTGCHAENPASSRVMEKAGFRREAHRIGAVWHDDRMKDRLEYAVNRDEFPVVTDQLGHRENGGAS